LSIPTDAFRPSPIPANRNSLPAGLYGGAGNDFLYGGNGGDHLDSGLGRDILFGGNGADVFDFNSVADSLKGGGQRDVVRDFSHRETDLMDLSSIDANLKTPGDHAFKFIGSPRLPSQSRRAALHPRRLSAYQPRPQ
jgi:hypothetical protein